VRVERVTAGPLLPDEGSRAARLIRRGRGIALESVAFVAVTVLFPILIVGAAAVDLALWLRRRKPWMATRLVAMAWWFLFGEMRGIGGLFGIWLLTGGPGGLGSERRRRWVYDLRIHWAASHLGGIRVLFGLTFDVEDLELAGPGPVLVFIRHASIIDNVMPDAVVGRAHGLGLRFVLKRELQMIPTIDIGGRWVPTSFIRRASSDIDRELAAVRLLAEDLGPGEGVLIYPEGTRHTDAKLARAKEKIAERAPEISPLAERLRNVLPPRLGGPVALLEAGGADVVFCGHVGLDGFEYISDIWSGGLVGTTVRVKFWRHAAAEVPADPQARIEWLYAGWQTLDDWVGEQRNDSGPSAPTPGPVAAGVPGPAA
jgi:1-acyl-sn-glycerol-3-phosphate acyltransferase